MEQKEEPLLTGNPLLSKDDKRYFRFICGGLIAVDFLFIQGYLSLIRLDSFEQTAMYCFAAAIPILVVFAIAASLITTETNSFWIKLGVASLITLAILGLVKK